MKAHEKLPTLEEIKEFNQMLRSSVPSIDLQIAEDMEALQAVKLEKLHTELEATKAKLEAAETEAARLELVAMEGAEALARERENSARIKRESDATREENQGLRVRLGYEKDLAKCTQQEVRRLRNLIQDWITADCEGNNNDILEAEEALREAVE